MKAVLATPVAVKELGLLMLKLGQQLDPVMKSVAGGRVLVLHAPAGLDSYQAGLVDIPSIAGESVLLNDDRLFPLWDALPAENEYYEKGLKQFVSFKHECQLFTEECHKELVLRKIGTSWVRLCWVHDNELKDEPMIKPIARRNQVAFWLSAICMELGLPAAHPLTLPELCWWLTLKGWIDRLPESVIRAVLGRPESSLKSTSLGMKSTDDLYRESPRTEIVQRTKPVVKFIADAEPPALFMLRPKPMRWENTSYTRYVKVLPCVVCGKQADDPHHLIGHGQGKMGGKTHDLFTIPLCRQHHNELHKDMRAWEREHGSQISHLLNTIDRALKEGALE